MYMNSSGFIAQLVQRATGSGFIRAQLVRAWHRYHEVTGSNPVEDPDFVFQASYAIA